MTAKQAQAAWDALRRERDDLQLEIDRCEETKTALHMNLRAMREDRDGLAAQVEVMRAAIGEAMGWNLLSDVESIPESVSTQLADALALPNTAAAQGEHK